MTTLHLQTETGHQTASTLKQNSSIAQQEVTSLHRALQTLEVTWQGNAQMEFMSEANSLMSQMQDKVGALQVLAERLEREVTEWEETDRRGAAAMRSAEAGWWNGLSFPWLPSSGGTSLPPNWWRNMFPVTLLSTVVPLVTSIPSWLDSFLDRFFAKPEIVSPIAEDQAPAPAPETPRTPLGELIDEPPASATESAKPETPQTPPPPQEPSGPKYDHFYDVPAKSQGDLYGSAACSPTSASMVMDYFHAQDAANATASPEQIITSLDRGDGTPGSGISLTNMNDELNELGYNNITAQVDANMDDLKGALETGPVIVTSGVKIVGPGSVQSSVPRDITGPGNVIHAMVVKGVSGDMVAVNDPWSGRAMDIPIDTFSQMWSKGSNGMYVIRP